MEQNNIKAIEMVRIIRDKQYKQTVNLNAQEKIQFYQQKAGSLMVQLDKMVEKRKQQAVTA